MDTFYSSDELLELGIPVVGENALISRKASIYEPSLLVIGSDVRIDDFCILSGSIRLGSHIHISAYCALYGKYGIEIGDYSGLSPRSTLLSGSDDFSGEYMISPMAPEQFTKVDGRTIRIGRFCQIGAGSIVMPGVAISEGAVVGALSFVKQDLDEWTIYAGNPLKTIKARKRTILQHYAAIQRMAKKDVR
jgi:acetyltransferase-like isoleucine patch superfamily enzyme